MDDESREDERANVVGARVEAMCGAPAGCGFLLEVEAHGLSPEQAAQPSVSLHLTAAAVRELSPWIPGHEQVVAANLAQGPRLRALCRAVLARPEAAWWFGPLERGSQEWISRDGDVPSADRFMRPSGSSDDFSRYAQKPRNGFFTSTGAGGTSSALALLANGYGDYDVDPPVIRYRVMAHSDARVFEIDGPAAWYWLCASYPATGTDGRLVPDWAAVAYDWNGIHLTLGGLLTAEQVRVEGPLGWAQHEGWDAEQTDWLQWVFDEVERLPDVLNLPTSPASRP